MSDPMFTPETVILDVLETDERVTQVFQKLGLKCLDCVAVAGETLRDAGRFHNIETDLILKELQKLNLARK